MTAEVTVVIELFGVVEIEVINMGKDCSNGSVCISSSSYQNTSRSSCEVYK